MRELWLRVGDGGAYESFGDDFDAAVDYLHELGVGEITGWRQAGFESVNYWGGDYVSCYWGDSDAQWKADLGDDDWAAIAGNLVESYL